MSPLYSRIDIYDAKKLIRNLEINHHNNYYQAFSTRWDWLHGWFDAV